MEKVLAASPQDQWPEEEILVTPAQMMELDYARRELQRAEMAFKQGDLFAIYQAAEYRYLAYLEQKFGCKPGIRYTVRVMNGTTC